MRKKKAVTRNSNEKTAEEESLNIGFEKNYFQEIIKVFLVSKKISKWGFQLQLSEKKSTVFENLIRRRPRQGGRVTGSYGFDNFEVDQRAVVGVLFFSKLIFKEKMTVFFLRGNKESVKHQHQLLTVLFQNFSAVLKKLQNCFNQLLLVNCCCRLNKTLDSTSFANGSFQLLLTYLSGEQHQRCLAWTLTLCSRTQ